MYNEIDLDTLVETTEQPKLDEIETKRTDLVDGLKYGEFKFNSWQMDFIENIEHLPLGILSLKQIEKIEEIYDNVILGE